MRFVTLLKRYTRKPHPGGKDYGATIKSERLIIDMQNIEPEEVTKKYDTFMSAGWCLWADYIYSIILSQQMEGQMLPTDVSCVLRALAPKMN